MKVLITGASGIAGSQLCGGHLDQSHNVQTMRDFVKSRDHSRYPHRVWR